MGKKGKERKRRREDALVQELGNTSCDLQPGDIFVTAKTLVAIASEPELYSMSTMKPIRLAMHRLLESQVLSSSSSTSSSLNSLHESITRSLRLGDWSIALELLANLREMGIIPKLGTLQRWVRECDGVMDISSTNIDLVNTSDQDDRQLCLRVLDSILRSADPSSIGLIKDDNNDPKHILFGGTLVRFLKDWVPVTMESQSESGSDNTNENEQNCINKDAKMWICCRVLAAMRTPKNNHDLIIWTDAPAVGSDSAPAISLSTTNNVKTEKYTCPFVKDCYLHTSLLHKSECKAIIDLAERMNFSSDEPLTVSAKKTSVLAHAFVWLVHLTFHDRLFARCKHLLPPGAVGFNRRFRCYRYRPGALYRPHIDGAWPPSGLSHDDITNNDVSYNDQNSELGYVYDSSKGMLLSRYTYLIYLNDSFEGGGTSFYSPSRDDGVLHMRAVRPMEGCALVFPHGKMSAALHEGSGVTKGVKYVIRTEVLFPISQ